jgi:hypothetical protein
LPIAVSSSVLGIWPASESLLAFTITMNRIVILRSDLLGPATVAPAFINKTSGLLRRRHVNENYFWSNSRRIASGTQGNSSYPGCLTNLPSW